MPHSTPKDKKPNPKTLDFIRSFARIYAIITDDENEAKQLAHAATHPLGHC